MEIPKYFIIKALCNTATGAYRGTLFDTIHYLRHTYGRMTKADLQQVDMETKQGLAVDPTMPIGIVFLCIDELEAHAITASTPYSEVQIVQIAYNLVNKVTVFGEYLHTWNKALPVDQTNHPPLSKLTIRHPVISLLPCASQRNQNRGI